MAASISPSKCAVSEPCTTQLRDSYGFLISGVYADVYYRFSSILKQEEEEKLVKWQQWVNEARDTAASHGGYFSRESSKIIDDCEILEHSLTLYPRSTSDNASTENGKDSTVLPICKQLRALVQMGIPMTKRPEYWKVLLNIKLKRMMGEYGKLVAKALARDSTGRTTTSSSSANNDVFCLLTLSSSTSDEFDSKIEGKQERDTQNQHNAEAQHTDVDWLKQIDMDLHRTFPGHPMMDSNGKAILRRILAAYSIYNPAIGYAQGTNFLAAVFLLVMKNDEEDAFWCLVTMIEDILPGYFDTKMVAPRVDSLVFAHLLRGTLPRVADHLENSLHVDISSATSSWFIVAFVNTLPLETCLRVWDLLFLELSSVVLFRAALTLIDVYSKALLGTVKDSSEAYALLQSLGPMTYDASTFLHSCIGFSYITDSAVSVLRDRYLPEVVYAMKGFFKGEEDMYAYFNKTLITKEAALFNRSRSLATTKSHQYDEDDDTSRNNYNDRPWHLAPHLSGLNVRRSQSATASNNSRTSSIISLQTPPSSLSNAGCCWKLGNLYNSTRDPDLSNPCFRCIFDIATKTTANAYSTVHADEYNSNDGTESGMRGIIDTKYVDQLVERIVAGKRLQSTQNNNNNNNNEPVLFNHNGSTTIDIGSYYGMLKVLKYRENGEDTSSMSLRNTTKQVLRRRSDGGAPLGIHKNLSWSDGDVEQKILKLQALRQQLAVEVAGAIEREKKAVKAAEEAVDTMTVLQAQLAKIQRDIDSKMMSLRKLYQTVSKLDNEIEKAQIQLEEQQNVGQLTAKAQLNEAVRTQRVQQARTALLMAALAARCRSNL